MDKRRDMELFRKGISKLVSDGLVDFLRGVSSYLRRRIKRSRLYVRTKYQLYHRLSGYKAIPDPFKIVYVSPAKIKRYSSEFGKWESVGKIQGGAWDKKAIPLAKTRKYQAVEEHFCQNVSWEDTGIIDYLLTQLSEKERTSIDGCRSREEIKDRYRRIDELYDKLQKEGYQESKHGPADYIAVHVGRDGELIFAGSGWHRLSLSKILNLSRIPVWIRARHKTWQNIRDQLHMANAGTNIEAPLERYLNHPDIKGVYDMDTTQ